MFYHRFGRSTVTLVIFCILLLVTACGRNQRPGQTGKGAREALTGSITVVGSTALQPLVEEAARLFSQENPEAEIIVQGGGSGTGLSQVSSGAADIGMSDITVEEFADVKSTNLVDNKVAIVGFAVVTHPAVGIRDLTKQQLIDIFTGKTKDWSNVGGEKHKITVVNRPQGSGTRKTFTNRALNGKEAIETITQDSSGTIRKIIAETPGAISYLALSYLNNTIQQLSIDGIAPTEANVRNRTYPIWSYEHLYTKGQPTGLANSFIDYVQGSSVQEKLLPKLGYVPITLDGKKQ